MARSQQEIDDIIERITPAETPFQQALQEGRTVAVWPDDSLARFLCEGYQGNYARARGLRDGGLPTPPKHKDWDRRFQCGAVWADKNGMEATVAAESPYDRCLKMQPAGDKSFSIYLPWRLDADFDFVRLDPPTSRLGNIQGIGVSAEPPEPLAYQDQYGDEDWL